MLKQIVLLHSFRMPEIKAFQKPSSESQPMLKKQTPPSLICEASEPTRIRKNVSFRYSKLSILYGLLALFAITICAFLKNFYITPIAIASLLAAVFYFQKRFTFDKMCIHEISPFGSKTILYSDIIRFKDQSNQTSQENSGNPIEIIGQNGVSMHATPWLEDFTGFKELVKSLAKNIQ